MKITNLWRMFFGLPTDRLINAALEIGAAYEAQEKGRVG